MREDNTELSLKGCSACTIIQTFTNNKASKQVMIGNEERNWCVTNHDDLLYCAVSLKNVLVSPPRVFSQHMHIRLIGDRVGSIYTVTLKIHASPHKFSTICCV